MLAQRRTANDPAVSASGTTSNATPSPKRRRKRDVRNNCVASDSTPAYTLNVPKNAASASVSGIADLAIARNCQAATVVTSDERQMTPEMARRCGDRKTTAKLWRSPPRLGARRAASSAGATRPVCGSGSPRSRQMSVTSSGQIASAMPVISSRFAVPSRAATAFVIAPPTIHPMIAPLPMIPYSRFASRVVRMWLASIQTCAGSNTPYTLAHT